MSEEGYHAHIHEVVSLYFVRSSPALANGDVLYMKANAPCAIPSNMSVHYVEVDEEESEAIIQEAMDLRRHRQAFSVQEPTPDLVLVQPIRRFT